MDTKTLIALFKTLSEKQKREFLDMVSAKETKPSVDIEQVRFSKGVVCPHCESYSFNRNGHTNGIQRFICKTCHKTFTYKTDTLTAYSKKDLSVWEKYIECMMDGLSIRKTAIRCNIAFRTSFLWRHKILDGLKKLQETVHMDGVVETDETFLPLSFKGNHKKSRTGFKLPRKPRKCGRDIHKRGLSKEQVCIPSGVNRTGLSVAKVGNLGMVNLNSVKKVLNNHIEKDSILCTDGSNVYKKFSDGIGVKEHIRLVKGRGKVRGEYSIGRINSYHSQLKTWLGRFKGISTKHTNNYLVWFNQVVWAKITDEEKFRTMCEWTTSVTGRTKNDEVSARNPVPVVA